MAKVNLTLEEKQILEGMHKEEYDKKTADKIKTLLFLDRWFTYQETAELLMLDRWTIREIVKKYKKDWIKKFLKTNYIFYEWKLSLEQKEEVSKYVESNYIWDVKLVVKFIEEKFNIKYSISWATKLLKRLWFTYKKTKLVPAKAEKEKQEQFIEKYKQLKETLKETEVILFWDGVHPIHNATNGSCWIKKWTEKEIKSNTWRNRININGAYCVDTQEIVTITSDKINAQSTIELYKKIEEKFPNMTTIYIIRDNARYYNCSLVKDYLKNSRIKEIPLPPYSPNLNPIEKLWKYFKNIVTSNKYYETFDDFKKEVDYFFGDWFFEHKKNLLTAVTDKMRVIQT